MFSKKVVDNRKSNRKTKKQKPIFEEVWNERKHVCYICSKHIQEPLTYVFAHWLSKWVHPEYKFDKRNIFLVCSLDCHRELDSKLAHKSITEILWM